MTEQETDKGSDWHWRNHGTGKENDNNKIATDSPTGQDGKNATDNDAINYNKKGHWQC